MQERASTTARPRRRRLTLSLGAMMLLIVPLGLWLGRRTEEARRQREVIAAVRAHGGWVHFDYEFVNDKLTPGRTPRAPDWLRRRLGDEYFREIRQVSFVYDDSTGPRYENRSTRSCDDVLALLAGQRGLRSLLMKGYQATDQGLAHLRGLTGLEDLYIWDSILIGDDGVENLRGLVNLKNLHLDNSKVTDAGFRHLARLEKLESLILQDHTFSDEGLAVVARMKGLKRLAADGTPSKKSRITDDGLAAVAGLRELEVLDLGHTRITDEGLRHLAGLGKLRILDLEGCPITDEGLAYLSGLGNLEWLILRGTKVEGDDLSSLEGLKKLKILSLPDGVSDEKKKEIRNRMPASVKVW